MPTDTRTRQAPSTQARWAIPAAGAVVGGLLVALVVGGGAAPTSLEGIAGPGPLVSWGLPLLRAVATTASILVVGLLLYAAVLGPQGRKGVLSQVGRRDVVKAGWVAAVWSLAALLTAIWSLAWALGLPVSKTITPDVVSTYAWSVGSVRAFLLVAIIAAVIAVVSIFTATVTGAGASLAGALIAVALPALTGHASSLGSHGVAMTSDVVHALAVTVWVGGLVILLFHAVRNDPGTMRAVPVFRTVATWSVVFLAISGAGAAFARMNSVSELWSTSFGILISLKVLLFFGLLMTARTMQSKVLDSGMEARPALIRFGGIEALLMAAAVGIGVALTQTAYPRTEIEYPTNAETLLGQAFPPPPTAMNVFLGWKVEPLFLGLAILGVGLYVAGVIKLRRRGDKWPLVQTASWILGWLFVVWATNAGVATYSMVSLKWHMVSHMVMSMVAPILLALSSPMTLALRALPATHGPRRGAREWLVWAMHTPVAKFVTHPLWALFVFTIGLYGLYYTSLFSWLMTSHIGHVAMQLHFLAAGYLFSWVVIQTDPLPRDLPHWQRLLLALVAAILHSFFAVPIMMSDTAFGYEWYSQVQPPWLDDLVADTRDAGGIAWGIAEIPTLLLVLAVSVQWARDDTREAKRRDRRVDRDGDAELAAYNENLRRLAERDNR
ncbi:MAG: cytochrome c oxidase assembly protein [Candidatus Nanopelagicales bacterium]|nr:cytochrome c oxidase assembly protein [Actinomycetota bacterium]HNL50751.1 cytochrome c oxidase assembly protein [Actinomycetota bacterium]HNO14653.1 cytochrome c oxidase assembly protein [Actinomycetota bacterium]HUM85807.1 cytochrome c oxidase assembly protein [Actinomycetota bacterium]